MTADSPQELSEKDFIQDDRAKDPRPYWTWGIFLSLFVALVWGLANWSTHQLAEEYKKDPFLQVTNRDFSIFLWQFPEYMRVNAKVKTGYLPAFAYSNEASVDPELADKYVIAPPELIFLYHTWNHFLRPEIKLRPISISAFQEFLKNNEQWQPPFWANAPADYSLLLEKLDQLNPDVNLQSLPDSILPRQVKEAFLGWKNFFKEGNAINSVEITYEKLEQFLANSPHYARNYWQNILHDTYPNYLKDFANKNYAKEEFVPVNQQAPFLKVAFYNYFHP